MKHYEPGKPYPQKKSEKEQDVYHRNSAAGTRSVRRRKVRRSRWLTAVILVLLVALAGLAFALTRTDAAGSGKNAASEASQPASSTAFQAQPTEAPTATPEPTAGPTATPEPTQVPAFAPTWDTAGKAGFPYLIAVNRQANTVTVYAQDAEGNYTVPYKAMVCSTGRDTPKGTFSTSSQYTWRALVGGVYGQYATRITSDILFHSVPYFSQSKSNLEYDEFNKLGTAASLGCIRLQVADCKWIFDECPKGTTVVLYDDADPGPLGKPDFTSIDTSSANRGWDPTDPDPKNPWKNS